MWFSSVTVKTYYLTMQCAKTCFGRRRKPWIGTPIFKSIQLFLNRLYRSNIQINSIYKWFIIESNVLYLNYWESSPCNFFLYSLRKHKWIETQISMFSTTSPTIAPWRRMFWLCQMKITNVVYMYFQSCQLMFRGLNILFFDIYVGKWFKEYFLINFSEIIFSPASDLPIF